VRSQLQWPQILIDHSWSKPGQFMLSGSAQKLATEDESWKEIMSFNKANKIILISKKHWVQDETKMIDAKLSKSSSLTSLYQVVGSCQPGHVSLVSCQTVRAELNLVSQKMQVLGQTSIIRVWHHHFSLLDILKIYEVVLRSIWVYVRMSVCQQHHETFCSVLQ